MIEKRDNNAAIVTRLSNVRPHKNADRIKLATVLGTQVIVGLDARENDLVLYFDSNLRLSHDYLHYNNLYSNPELNLDKGAKGYFDNNGRVRAQRFRGEVSNGYVAGLNSLWFVDNLDKKIPYGYPILEVGDEFTHVNGIEICSKYFIPQKYVRGKSKPPKSAMFHKHWDTKQLMRELDSIPEDALCWVEEKIHGTSGRTANVLCKINRPWYKFWQPKEEWKVISGTRRVDDIDFHLGPIRAEVERRVAPHLHKGEQIYYEIYGYEGGKEIQPGFHYNCRPGEFKTMLYRVTLTTPDGYCIDLDREQVYKRAEELELEKPYLFLGGVNRQRAVDEAKWRADGRSMLDAGTLREGVTVWFKDSTPRWTCLKLKSEKFLLHESGLKDKDIGDCEDTL